MGSMTKKEWETHREMIMDAVGDQKPMPIKIDTSKEQQLKIIQFNLYKTIQLINTFLEENKNDGGVNTE
jgi:hypothetical protein